jgi:hypothetical protein
MILFALPGSASVITGPYSHLDDYQGPWQEPTPFSNTHAREIDLNGATGTALRNVFLTFYGFDDNDNGEGSYGTAVLSDPVIHPLSTEDLGTFDQPITFATDYRIAIPGTIIYVPKVRKYFIMEDTCVECISDADAGRTRIDLYIGGNTVLQGDALIACQRSLTAPDYTDKIILNPSSNWPVNPGKLFDPSTGICNRKLFRVP